MIYAFKIGFIIAVFTACMAYVLQNTVGKSAKDIGKVASFATAGSLAILCISQIWIAFAGVFAIISWYAIRRVFAAGLCIFLIITMPGVNIILMAGNLQLINFSIITSIILGLFFASFFWSGNFRSQKHTNDYSMYAIVAILTFIPARDTTFTNILRLVAENILSFVVPYILVRNSLRDATSIRNMIISVILAGLAISAVSIFESFMVWPMYQTYGQNFGTLLNAGIRMRGGMLRASGPSMNPPLSSAVLAFCFVTAFASSSIFKNKNSHRLILFIIALGLFAMQSRVGWLGAVVGSVAVVIAKRGVSAFTIYVPILLVLSGTVYTAASFNPSFANLVGFSADAKGSSEYRERLSDRGVEIIKLHPLIGQSYPTVESQMVDLRQGEGIIDFVNGYLSIALFSGLIGLGVFVSGLLYQGYNIYSGRNLAIRRGAGGLTNIGFGIIATAIAIFPFVPTDYRIVLVMILLFALSNAIITHSHVNATIHPSEK